MPGDMASRLLGDTSDEAQALPEAKVPRLSMSSGTSADSPIERMMQMMLVQQQQMQQVLTMLPGMIGSSVQPPGLQPAAHVFGNNGDGAASTTSRIDSSNSTASGGLLDPKPPEPRVDDKLEPATVAHLKKTSRDFGKTINKYIFAASMERKMDERIEVMSGDGYRYPPGVKPFGVPVELLELASPLEEAVDGEYTLSVTVPRGATRKDMMRAIHHRVALFNANMYKRAYQERAQTLRPATSHDQYLLACNSQDAGNDEVDLLGLDAPLAIKRPNAAKAREYAEHQYALIMKKLKEKLRKQDEKTRRKRTRQRMREKNLSRLTLRSFCQRL